MLEINPGDLVALLPDNEINTRAALRPVSQAGIFLVFDAFVGFYDEFTREHWTLLEVLCCHTGKKVKYSWPESKIQIIQRFEVIEGDNA